MVRRAVWSPPCRSRDGSHRGALAGKRWREDKRWRRDRQPHPKRRSLAKSTTQPLYDDVLQLAWCSPLRHPTCPHHVARAAKQLLIRSEKAWSWLSVVISRCHSSSPLPTCLSFRLLPPKTSTKQAAFLLKQLTRCSKNNFGAHLRQTSIRQTSINIRQPCPTTNPSYCMPSRASRHTTSKMGKNRIFARPAHRLCHS